MNDSFDVSTIIFAALAVFVVWKLRSVLGTRTGEERPPFNPFARRDNGPAAPGQAQPEGKVIALPSGGRPATRPVADPDRWNGIAEAGSPLAADLDRIAAADPSFAARGFLDGAKAAYEMILAAFAKGDTATLSGLLAKDVLEGFASAIADRQTRGETAEHAMVALDSAKITHAQLTGGAAQITVLFDSQQVNTVRNREGAVQGAESVGPVVDEWTFARATTARDPNWTLIATDAG